MKKAIALACIIVAGFSFVLVSGCKKVLDYIHDNNDKVKKCRIESVIFSDTISFLYNSHGDPVSLRYAKPVDVDAYSNDKAFRYDEQHRILLYLKGAIDYDRALQWHKYTYVSNYLIIDTTWGYTEGDWSASDRPANASFYYVTKFELDGLGRIIKETTDFVPESSNEDLVVLAYAYDGNGNLIKPGVTYSNEISMWQTNKVWMFLNRDYSVNSPVGLASEYNQHKLPVKLNVMPEFFYDFEFSVPDMMVSYKCK